MTCRAKRVPRMESSPTGHVCSIFPFRVALAGARGLSSLELPLGELKDSRVLFCAPVLETGNQSRPSSMIPHKFSNQKVVDWADFLARLLHYLYWNKKNALTPKRYTKNQLFFQKSLDQNEYFLFLQVFLKKIQDISSWSFPEKWRYLWK